MVHGAVSSQQTQDAEAPDESGASPHDRNDDVALALALAQTARTVEHVVDLGAGRYGVAATYGPGQRVKGIVLRRSALSEGNAAASVVEAHIVIAAAAVTSVMTPAAQQKKQRLPATTVRRTSAKSESPVLLRIAAEARRALAATLQRLRSGEQWDIDIVIDDLRDTAAHASSGAE
jgi:hypothetical protein